MIVKQSPDFGILCFSNSLKSRKDSSSLKSRAICSSLKFRMDNSVLFNIQEE